ncbi:hypothetical protein AK830_g7461 [Neonectria ditissima]|uniref:Uncharacterized protein n=1 Tax=Neonectria ditissima TaxID=78410 RepID=A0A0N8H6J0_9HYPO|nr:hypothetical protein AK830_g7461 [Neonectria ditissima]
MARAPNRKRLLTDEPSTQDYSPTKSRKTRRVDESPQDDGRAKRPRKAVAHPNCWQYPPEFWDRLSQIPPINGALQELDRQTCGRPSCPSPSTALALDLPTMAPGELAQFARHGKIVEAFRNLDALADGTLALANLDLYYGAYPEDLNRSTRNELASYIIPSTMQDKIMAPNLFIEVKGPDGNAAVAAWQARYDGAIGSRGIHSLQNYGAEEPQYDDQAYICSSTYHNGSPRYTPTTPQRQERTEYHMTQLRTFAMTDTREAFIEGATVFRNARYLAKLHLDNFIRAANARASEVGMTSQEDVHETNGEASASCEFHESVDGSDYVTLQNTDNALQQHMADTSNYAFQKDGETTAIPNYRPPEEDSQEPSQESTAPELDNPSTSLVSSLTSSFNNTPISSKCHRQPPSPPSKSKGSRTS